MQNQHYTTSERFHEYVFKVLITIWTIVIGALFSITFLSFNKKVVAYTGFFWAKGVLFYLKLRGISYSIEGLDKLPKGPFIISCKHQSAWETIFFLEMFVNPVYVLKRELCYIPVYGWYLPLMGMISVDRGKSSAIKKLAEKVKTVMSDNRVLVIFPEGTRVSPGQSVEYKSGIYTIHKALPHIPIVPAVLNSGLCWPGRTFITRPGTITLKFLPPMHGEFGRRELLDNLKKIMDRETNRL